MVTEPKVPAVKLDGVDELLCSAVLATLERAPTLSRLLDRMSRLATAAEVRDALQELSQRGEVAVTVEIERPRGSMQSASTVEFRLRRTVGGEPGSFQVEFIYLVYAAITGRVQRDQPRELTDWLRDVPREPVRLSQLAALLSPNFTVAELREAVRFLAGSHWVQVVFVPGDLELYPGPVKPAVNPEKTGQGASQATKKLVAKALATLRDSKTRKAS